MRNGLERLTRRQSLRRLAGFAAAAFAAPTLNRGWFEVFAQTASKYSTRAIDLLNRATTIDMLDPFTLVGVLAPFKGDKRPTWFTNPETFTEEDFQRFKESRTDVMHIGVGTTGPDAYEQTMRFIGRWNGLIAHQDRYLLRIDEAARIGEAKKSGKVGIILGVQNSEHFARPMMSIFSISSANECRS